MARYIGPVCRLCRREGEKLFLKGERCYTNKCAIERREGVPGQHSRGRQSRSDYKLQLRAKQKARRYYGLLEHQFEKRYTAAARAKGVTGTLMLVGCERRLDNIVHRMGFAGSRKQARQLVSHKHIMVNGRTVNRPGYQVNVGDVIEVRDRMKENLGLNAALQQTGSRLVPEWLAVDVEAKRGTVNSIPTRDQLPQSINEQLIVELYSR